MQKGLCVAAISIAVIVLALFLADLILGFAGMAQLAPFKNANMVLDIIFAVCAGILGTMSWFTLKEQN